MFLSTWLRGLRRRRHPRPVPTIRRLGVESLETRSVPNATLATATPVSLTPGVEQTVSGGIFDDSVYHDLGPFGGYYTTSGDVDMYAVPLAAGQQLVADIDARQLDGGGSLSNLDSVLRVFDATGRQLAVDDDAVDPDTDQFSYDSNVFFTAPADGTYYVGVSGYSNFSYDPTIPDTAAPGMSQGAYQLQLLIHTPPAIALTGGAGFGTTTDAADNSFRWQVNDQLYLTGVSTTVWRNGSVIYSQYTGGRPDLAGAFDFNSYGPGTYQLSVTATDIAGQTSNLSGTQTVLDDDTAGPSIVLGGSSGTESHGLTQQFTWDVSDPSGLSGVAVQVTRDSASGPVMVYSANGLAAAHGSFNFDSLGLGTYTITVSATDADNDWPGDQMSAGASRSVTVTNSPPVAVIAPNLTGDEGQAITFDGRGSSDPDGDPLTYAWTFGDGGTATGPAPTHAYADNGTYAVTLTVTDPYGATSTSTATAVVNNVAPQNLAVAGPDAGVRGQTLAFAGSFTDPGVLDTHEVRWDFGDGTVADFQPTTAAGALTPAHVYTASGSYTVTMTVRDNDGGVSSASETVTVGAVLMEGNDLYVGGTTGNDVIAVNRASAAGGVAVSLNGASAGSYFPAGRVVAFGQAGNDYLIVASNVTNDAWLFGGDGNDYLQGGAGNNVLAGGAGNDLLAGYTGRDLLIGGAGADRLTGNAGDDILVAGSSVYDSGADLATLGTIMSGWVRTDVTYSDRVADARVYLNGQTMFDDGAVDTLTGSAGQDWFLAQLGGTSTTKDRVVDPASGESTDGLAG